MTAIRDLKHEAQVRAEEIAEFWHLDFYKLSNTGQCNIYTMAYEQVYDDFIAQAEAIADMLKEQAALRGYNDTEVLMGKY